MVTVGLEVTGMLDELGFQMFLLLRFFKHGRDHLLVVCLCVCVFCQR